MIRLRTLINQSLELKVSGSFAASTAGGEPKFHFFDELGNRLRGKVTNSLFNADSGQPAELKALKTGSVYQIDVSYLDNMTGTAFMRYGLAGARADLNVVIKVEGLPPDKAMTAGKALDVSKTFYPLAQNPVLGSAFYFKQAEVFGKPGARVALYIDCPTPPAGLAQHSLAWEYWNGDEWTTLLQSSRVGSPSKDLTATEVIEFTGPSGHEIDEGK